VFVVKEDDDEDLDMEESKMEDSLIKKKK